MKRVKHQDGSAERQPAKAAPDAKQLRKLAGDWLKQRRADAELSQADLAARLGLKYYTFISQVENGFSRVPTEIMGAWAGELGLEPAVFARHLLRYYEPELHRLLFGAEST
ncbi:helix-turn-helix domain-containing protein [Bradyrhizobium murdochi]|uniref:helix-turn-helix domain-containing protein n=1 Tax=Bradyrhizobium murdochi TaxID=1038859 RepID=UPI0006865683|nr:helix-turn-helix transcriptional regulator [Bradyrhizobium murdochi]